jgi:hypothetical protein
MDTLRLQPDTLLQPPSAAKIPVRWPGPSSQGGICEVHRAGRIEDTVPILYGQMYIDPATTNFPNALCFVGGGCKVRADRPTQAVVFFCPPCRQAEQEWKKHHGR